MSIKVDKTISIGNIIVMVTVAVALTTGYVTMQVDIKNHTNQLTSLKVDKLDKEMYKSDMEHVDETEETLFSAIKENTTAIRGLNDTLIQYIASNR